MRMRTTIGLSLAVLLVASTAAMARQIQSADQQPRPSVKSKPTKTAAAATRTAAQRTVAQRTAAQRNHAAKPAGRAAHRRGEEASQDAAALPPADQHAGAVQIAGQREIGAAAWYGGRHIGQRMANGERLDAVRATAAHRSLPMHSLVRVTNLNNGRSVIAKITDRGPVSQRLLIDVSPRAADVLDMKRSGIATVSIEPVVPMHQAANPAPAVAANPAAYPYPAPAMAANPAAYTYPAPVVAANPAAYTYPAPAVAANPAAYPVPAEAANPAKFAAPAAAVNPAAYPALAAAVNPAAYPVPSLAVNQAASVAQQ
jgi:rare lipoprotein A (peptidoglycan hydrolase)